MIQISVVNKAFEGGQSRLSGANAGIVLTTTDGRGNASVVEQNVLGWTTKTTDAAGNATTTAYDLAHGKPSCVTDALGKTHRFAYDLHGNVAAEFGTGAQPAVFAYDAADRKISQKLFRAESASAETDPRSRTDGDETLWFRDAATGLTLTKRFPDETETNYAYDAHNRLSSTTLAREVSPGVRLKLTRAYADLTGELVSLTSNDGTVSETCAYDRLGHLVSASDASGATSYQYDEYGELSEETKSGGLFVPTKTLTYHRDGFGRDAGYSIDGARKTTLSYDPATGRIASVSVSGAGVFSWEYLAGTSLKSKLSYPNSATAEWTYEEKRDLLASVKNTVNGSVISRYAYENDAAGRRVSSVKSGAMMGAEAETLSYGYDARGELVSAISDVNPDYAYGYGFDEAGNRNSATEAGTQLTYTTNALNQYASVSEGGSPVRSRIRLGRERDAASDFDGNVERGVQRAQSPGVVAEDDGGSHLHDLRRAGAARGEARAERLGEAHAPGTLRVCGLHVRSGAERGQEQRAREGVRVGPDGADRDAPADVPPRGKRVDALLRV